ncbi:SRPBCC family protein [Actinomadura graeca]|uniref:SRPBCC family protein n=1 Tax=Actinomadura graeca TaxID=2750812 RepID=A0ABX8QXE3_9ACTN|nr:SRPBCC family protein [Actinomadura graeca]QXJ23402.1 SRPBCC family protein [Actinomadura graeca]
MTGPATVPQTRTATHTIEVRATAGAVYQLVADVTRWPVIFGPTVHVERTHEEPGAEHFRIWATVNGQVKNWESRRRFDPRALRISFRQVRSAAPLASMGGEWTFRPLGPARCEVVLQHHYAVIDDDPAAVAAIARALDDNSEAELGALRRVAELGCSAGEAAFAFDDVVYTTGRARDVMDFLARGDLWAERIPHVKAAQMSESDGVQRLTMDTETPDGSTHRTSSTRLLIGDTLVYKQHLPPKLLIGHAGQWAVRATQGDGAVVTARHMVLVDPESVQDVLGAEATLADARRFVRRALSDNSTKTLELAGAYAESSASPAERE